MREVERIAQLLELTFDGQAYHGPSVRRALRDVDVGIAARRPEGGVHTIWELVSHMTSELRHACALLEGNAEPWVEGRTTWPAPPASSAAAWAQAQSDLGDANRALVGAVKRLDDAVLGEELLQMHRTYYVMLHGIIQHNVYHAGQISVLKRQLASTNTGVFKSIPAPENAVHQFNPHMQPDSAFVPGAFKYLVVGNRGRWMDPRRTPFHIVTLVPDTGHFVLEIDDFEDTGTRLEIPFEVVKSYQLAVGSAEASPEDIAQFTAVVERLDRPLQVECVPRATAHTLERLRDLQEFASAWLGQHSAFLKGDRRLDAGSRRGPHQLAVDLQTFMKHQALSDVEEGFATSYVSNPHAELVKGHRIVLAELGLVDYRGSIVRDPALFDDPWAKERRAEHILSRLAFIRAFFEHVGLAAVTLYRGLVFDGRPQSLRNESFVSASFDPEVAKSCFVPHETRRSGLLIRQVIPIERIFMTYLETAQLNRQFLEAEAVLLYEAGNQLF
jgi:hypothetical protein